MAALTHSSLSYVVVFPFGFSLCGSRTMSLDLYLLNILKTLLNATSVKEATFRSISYVAVRELSFNKVLYTVIIVIFSPVLKPIPQACVYFSGGSPNYPSSGFSVMKKQFRGAAA
jgi:hypothetical protein